MTEGRGHTGAHPGTIDDKNRLSIQKACRELLSTGTRQFVLKPGRRLKTLELRPANEYWADRANEVPGDLLSDDAYTWRQFEYSQTETVEADAQGRVLIADWLREYAEIGREVMVVGCKDRIEIWNRAEFIAFLKEMYKRYPQERAKAMNESRGLAGPAVATGTATS